MLVTAVFDPGDEVASDVVGDGPLVDRSGAHVPLLITLKIYNAQIGQRFTRIMKQRRDDAGDIPATQPLAGFSGC
ncbi:hypothetical protein D3C84_921190 [compost metagenome]